MSVNPHLKLDMDRVEREDERCSFLQACSRLDQRNIFNLVDGGERLDMADTLDDVGQNGLHFVVATTHPDEKRQANLVKYLLSKGADINQARTTDGWTPLFLAVMWGRAEIVSLLLARGAKPRITDQMGMTCEDWARAYRFDKIQQLLLHARSKLPHSRFSIVTQGPPLQNLGPRNSLGSNDTLSESSHNSQSSEDSSLSTPSPSSTPGANSHPSEPSPTEACLLTAQ
ncbi:hypothetical protein TCAL_02148 [Tigriopus californicus]|uniref:Uncharacterized protein n=1 Tax=Tigriopus californicus TaxID=6832 RepID=A0A553N7M1_TIGCA|nr:histone-lysine N-methyltransferase EHMT1-like [Tigriopus californicus]TRY61437.1 hypothetical protein TCAL_02148 [Tigriopus californicus]